MRERLNPSFIITARTDARGPLGLDEAIRRGNAYRDAGASVIAVEHNLDVVRAADHVIDLGPDAGPHGGRVVGEGRREEIARLDTPTGAALRAAGIG